MSDHPRPTRHHFLHELRARHAKDRAVERAGSHAHLPFTHRLDLLGDRVSVSLAIGQGEQDVKDGGREREEAFGSFPGHVRLDRDISAVDIYIRHGSRRKTVVRPVRVPLRLDYVRASASGPLTRKFEPPSMAPRESAPTQRTNVRRLLHSPLYSFGMDRPRIR